MFQIISLMVSSQQERLFNFFANIPNFSASIVLNIVFNPSWMTLLECSRRLDTETRSALAPL